MNWLQQLDAGLFHCVNPALGNSFFDVVMPFMSGNPLFVPAFLIACALSLWKGGPRGRICVLMLVLAIALGDGVVCNNLKHLIERPRPFWVLTDVHLPPGIGRTDSGAMPSSHAANWFAATMVLYIYYRKSIRFMLPLALLVSFSRVYNGVHYPGDVLVGAVLGAGYAAGGVWLMDALWQWAGRRWFPLWWQRLPSLMNPVILKLDDTTPAADKGVVEQHWLRLGYALIFLQLAANLIYTGSGIIGLSEDEAYQWVWSKHLALSYYSKPPLIAYTQFLGTSLWGDTVFGVRFFSPIIAAIISVVVLRFMARVAGVRPAFWLSLAIATTPLLALGSTLMTIDPLSVMFWTLAMVAGWRAIQENSTNRDWLMVGLWMGLGFLSKYTALFQLLSWAVLFALLPSARKQLRRPGPYLALLVNLLCAVPVVLWNYQHDWITVRHVAEGGSLDHPWSPSPANLWHGFVRFTLSFVGSEAGLLNPFFFVPMLWAAFFFWRHGKNRPLMLYFFCMGAPLFLSYFLFTFHSRVLPNWIAPAVLPLFFMAAIYWDEQWQAGFRGIKHWLTTGIVVGAFIVVLMHDLSLLSRITGKPVPLGLDATLRVYGWPETMQKIEEAREKLLAEGKPVFVIGSHYGITGEMSFYIPEATRSVRDNPLVYFRSSTFPENQFYFWPGYGNRTGQNAIYVEVLNLFTEDTYPPPAVLLEEFEFVTSQGSVTVLRKGRPVRRIQIYECRNLIKAVKP
jgi:4-amino-4-deoxy-L-arabinose transferase-like glycosyltransferase/membrane-associated phospholipid phosphatase